MKILLDECVPVLLRHELLPHQVFTVTNKEWKGIVNGQLVSLAAADGFEAMLTMDQLIEKELDPATLPLTVVILQARSNSLKRLLPLAPQLLSTLALLPRKSIVHIR
jgi:hypothetical protein